MQAHRFGGSFWGEHAWYNSVAMLPLRPATNEPAFARVSTHFIPLLLEAAEVSSGHRILDIATGTGLAQRLRSPRSGRPGREHVRSNRHVAKNPKLQAREWAWRVACRAPALHTMPLHLEARSRFNLGNKAQYREPRRHAQQREAARLSCRRAGAGPVAVRGRTVVHGGA